MHDCICVDETRKITKPFDSLFSLTPPIFFSYFFLKPISKRKKDIDNLSKFQLSSSIIPCKKTIHPIWAEEMEFFFFFFLGWKFCRDFVIRIFKSSETCQKQIFFYLLLWFVKRCKWKKKSAEDRKADMRDILDLPIQSCHSRSCLSKIVSSQLLLWLCANTNREHIFFSTEGCVGDYKNFENFNSNFFFRTTWI